MERIYTSSAASRTPTGSARAPQTEFTSQPHWRCGRSTTLAVIPGFSTSSEPMRSQTAWCLRSRSLTPGRLYGFQDQGFLNVQFGPPLLGNSSMLVLTSEGAMTRLAEFDLSIVDGIEGRASAFHILAGPRFFDPSSRPGFFAFQPMAVRLSWQLRFPQWLVAFRIQIQASAWTPPVGSLEPTSRRSESPTPTPTFEGGVFRFEPATKTYEVQFQFPFSQSNALQRPAEGPAWIDGAWVGFAIGFPDGGMYRIDPSGLVFTQITSATTQQFYRLVTE